MLDLTRRKFLVGLGLVGIAPAIVKIETVMRIRPVEYDYLRQTVNGVLWEDIEDLGTAYARALARSTAQTKIIAAASVFNRASGDGISLISMCHPNLY